MPHSHGGAINQDDADETAPLISSTPKGKTMKRFLRQGTAFCGAVTAILWVALLCSGAVDGSLKNYTPHTSCIDIIFVDVINTLIGIVCVFRATERSMTLGLYLSSLCFLVLLTKPWVYRAWATHPACTAALVVATLASVARMYIPYQLVQLDKPEAKNKLEWKALRKILRPYFIPTGCRNKLFVVITWFVLICGKVCNIVNPIILGMIVTKLTKMEDPTKLICIYCALNVAPKVFSEIQDVLYVKVWQRAFSEVADTTFRHVHSLSLEWHLKKKMGNIMRSIDRGMNAADNLMYYAMLFLLPAIGSAMAAFIVFVVHFEMPEIAAICFLGFCLYMWVTLVVTLWRRKFRQEMNKHDNNMHDVATDSMINFETVKYFTNEDFEAERYNKGVESYQQSSYTSQASISVLNVTQATTIQLSMLGSLIIAAYAVRHREDDFNVGSFVAVQAYVLTIFQPLSYLGMVYSSIINSMVDLQNLSELLSAQPDVTDADGAKPLQLDSPKGAKIEFRNVRFRYDSQTEDQGIKHISFTIPAGTTTAIVGQTGSGKTTVSRLLFRFYDIQEGSIIVGNQDVSKVTQKSLRRAIGIVPQDTCMFNDTIISNIRYGRNDATDEECYEAAKKAQLYDMVEKLDEKWNTVVGERGLKLSGGEKQRVAIARCLLKNPPIVVLDEATSALDNKTEREIQNALSCLSGRTTLVVAHRLTTIQHAEQIIVMKDGNIAERGTHAELLEKENSIYHEMWYAQANAVAAASPDNAATAENSSSDNDSKDE